MVATPRIMSILVLSYDWDISDNNEIHIYNWTAYAGFWSWTLTVT